MLLEVFFQLEHCHVFVEDGRCGGRAAAAGGSCAGVGGWVPAAGAGGGGRYAGVGALIGATGARAASTMGEDPG